MNAAQLALDEGFLVDPEGHVQQAKTLMSRCVRMGCRWVDIDRQTDEVLYFRMKREKRESSTREVLTAEELKSGVPLPGRSATPKDAEFKEKIEDEVKPEGKPGATAKTKTWPQAMQRQREFRSGWPAKSRAKATAQPEPEEGKAFEVACGAGSGNGAHLVSRGDDQERRLDTTTKGIHGGLGHALQRRMRSLRNLSHHWQSLRRWNRWARSSTAKPWLRLLAKRRWLRSRATCRRR